VKQPDKKQSTDTREDLLTQGTTAGALTGSERSMRNKYLSIFINVEILRHSSGITTAVEMSLKVDRLKVGGPMSLHQVYP
jgi:hypothetical protein